jgi:hypothetical protein
MVEAIIAISMMILFFGGMVFFQALYHQQIVTQNEAQMGAVQYAMGACLVNPEPVAGGSGTLTPLPATNSLQPNLSAVQIAGQGAGPVGDMLTLANLGTAALVSQFAVVGTDPVTVSVPNRFSQSTSSTAFATCSDDLIVQWATFQGSTRNGFWPLLTTQFADLYATSIQNAYTK